jgi:hypothetical protein
MAAVKIPVTKEVLDLIAKWDSQSFSRPAGKCLSKVTCYVSKASPIATLQGLTRMDVAFWGTELAQQNMDFLNATGIAPGGAGHIIGVGNRPFTADFQKQFPGERSLKLFCTWDVFEGAKDDRGLAPLEGAVKVIFVLTPEKKWWQFWN